MPRFLEAPRTGRARRMPDASMDVRSALRVCCVATHAAERPTHGALPSRASRPAIRPLAGHAGRSEPRHPCRMAPAKLRTASRRLAPVGGRRVSV
jgi:hypothetical protein